MVSDEAMGTSMHTLLHPYPRTTPHTTHTVPEGATFAELRLKVGPLAEPLGIMARMTQLLPHTRYSNTEKRAYLQLSAHDVHTLTVGVSAGTALEVTLAQFWSSMGDGVVHAQVCRGGWCHGGVVGWCHGGCVCWGGGGLLKEDCLSSLRMVWCMRVGENTREGGV